MAENGGEVRVAIRAALDQFKNDLIKAQVLIRDVFVPSIKEALSRLWQGAVTGLKFVVNEYANSELVAAKFTQALKNQGVTSRDAVHSLLGYASALEQVSTESDEAIVGAMTMLTGMGLTGKELKEATKVALDFADKAGGLDNAARLIGMAFRGNTERLHRYGIVIDESIPKSQRFAEVLRQMAADTGGSAAAKLDTFSGQLALMHNNISNIAEEIGKGLVPKLREVIEYINTHKEGITRFVLTISTEIISMARNFADLAIAAGNLFGWLSKLVGLDLSKILKVLVALNPATAVRGVVEEAAKAFRGEEPVTSARIVPPSPGGSGAGGRRGPPSLTKVFSGKEETGGDQLKRLDKGAVGDKAGPKEFVAQWNEAFDKVKSVAPTVASTIGMAMSRLQSTMSSGFNTVFRGLAEGTQTFGQIMGEVMIGFRDMAFQIVSDLLAQFITAEIAKIVIVKTGQEVERMERRHTAVESIAASAAKGQAEAVAANAGIPVFGIALGIAAAAVILGIIAAFAKFEKGGIVNSPTLAMIGETGDREAVINLDSASGKRALREAGGGGSGRAGDVTVNISGVFLEADAAKWDRLVRRQIIPALAAFGLKTGSLRELR